MLAPDAKPNDPNPERVEKGPKPFATGDDAAACQTYVKHLHAYKAGKESRDDYVKGKDSAKTQAASSNMQQRLDELAASGGDMACPLLVPARDGLG